MGSVLQSRARLVFLGCLLVAGYFAYDAIGGAIHNHQLSNERSQAAAEVSALEAKKAYLEGVRQYAASDAYVEQEARRQLGYIRPGEVPFVVVSPPAPDATVASGEWWERLFPR